jgi:hypothetical protein
MDPRPSSVPSLAEARPLPGPPPSMMTALPPGSRSNRTFVAGSWQAPNPLKPVGHMLPGMRGEVD